jgi:O-antigen/teichoic acid export membrane protein
LKFSIPVSIAGAVGGIANSISPILLGRFTSSAIVGNVGVSIRTGNIISLAVDSAGASLLPFFSTVNSVGNAKVSANNISRAFNYSIYIILMLFLPSSVFFAVLSKDISRVLFGSSYIMAPYYISIVSIGIIISMLASYTSTLLISAEKVVKVMKYTILVSIAEIILLLLLVKSIGGFALILSLSVVGPLISLALYIHIAISEVKIKLSTDKSMRVLLAAFISALALVPIAFYFSHGTLYGSIAAMILGFITILIIYPPLIAILKGIEQKDIDRIKLIGKEIPIAGSLLLIIAAYVEHFAAR